MPVEKYASEDLCVVSCQIQFLDNRHLTTFLASEPLAKRPHILGLRRKACQNIGPNIETKIDGITSKLT